MDEDIVWKYWAELGTCLERLHGLRNVLTVHNVGQVLGQILTFRRHELDYDRKVLLHQLSFQHSWYTISKYKFVEFFDDFPSELNECINFSKEEMPFAEMESDHVRALCTSDWLDKRTRHVFGWWR